MIERVEPGRRSGVVRAPSSKSQAHRLLIAAALSKHETSIRCDDLSADITATVDCLGALGARITRSDEELRVSPIGGINGGEAALHCGESGSTLRFLLPLCGALGARAVFYREGRLPERPLKPLDEQLTAHGMALEADGALLHVCGQLSAGEYVLPGNVSSQYVTGLLMALPLLSGDSVLRIEGRLESADYVAMTLDTLEKSGIHIEALDDGWHIPGAQCYNVPEDSAVEGDHSGAAFFLCMGAFSDAGITVTGLDPDSKQGDRRVAKILEQFGARVEYGADRVTVRQGSLYGARIDASMIPDLVPALSAVAALCEGETRFTHAERLRLKESDRLAATKNLITALGGDARETDDGLAITGKPQLEGGTVDPCGDHRLAMTAAVAACGSAHEVIVPDAQCVNKSYPAFWNDMKRLEVE